MADQKMTESERQEFLAELHVGVLGIERPDGPPLVVPVWYSYEPGGDVEVLTAASSLKGRLAATAGRASLCAQQEELPYKYVSVEGPLEIVALDADASRARRRADGHPLPRRGDGPRVRVVERRSRRHPDPPSPRPLVLRRLRQAHLTRPRFPFALHFG